MPSIKTNNRLKEAGDFESGKNDKGENDISLSASDKSLEANDKSLDANDISLGANDKSLDGNDKSLGAHDISLAANDKSLGANDISLGANDKSLRANDISLRTNDISLGANDKSHRTQRDIVIVKTKAPRYLARYISFQANYRSNIADKSRLSRYSSIIICITFAQYCTVYLQRFDQDLNYLI